jgi:hypothetical protein
MVKINLCGYGTGYRMAYARENYIIVLQDVRGRHMSEGEFMDVRPYIKDKKTTKDIDEASDTYDAIDWLVKNVDNNNEKGRCIRHFLPGVLFNRSSIEQPSLH